MVVIFICLIYTTQWIKHEEISLNKQTEFGMTTNVNKIQMHVVARQSWRDIKLRALTGRYRLIYVLIKSDDTSTSISPKNQRLVLTQYFGSLFCKVKVEFLSISFFGVTPLVHILCISETQVVWHLNERQDQFFLYHLVTSFMGVANHNARQKPRTFGWIRRNLTTRDVYWCIKADMVR